MSSPFEWKQGPKRRYKIYHHPFNASAAQHAQHDLFLECLAARRMVYVTFFSKEDGMELRRLCAPLDFGPSRLAQDSTNRYHVHDYESDKSPHPLAKISADVRLIEITSDIFDPAHLITWSLTDHPWYTKRDWGQWS